MCAPLQTVASSLQFFLLGSLVITLFCAPALINCLSHPPSIFDARSVLGADSLLRSSLNHHFDGNHTTRSRRTPSAASPSSRRGSRAPVGPPSTPPPESTPTRPPEKNNLESSVGTATATYYPGHNKTSKNYLSAASPYPGKSPSLPSHVGGGGGRGAWVMWGFYAKFAERCLNDPRLALNALDQAVVTASTATSISGGARRPGAHFSSSGARGGAGGGGVGSKGLSCGEALPLVARAQLCQRWPNLADGAASSFPGRLCCGDASSPERILLDATKR